MSLTNTLVRAIESTTPELDGPVYAVSSGALVDLMVFLLCGIDELGF